MTSFGSARSVARAAARATAARRQGARAILPLDVEGAPSVAAAFGVKPLTAAWADGPLFQLYNFDNPAAPVTWSAKGLEGDIEALAAILEIDPVTGIGGAVIEKAYDQSGHGRDFTTDADILNKPDLWLIEGKVYYFGGGFLSFVNGNTIGTYLNISDDVSLDMHNHALFAVHKPYSLTNGSAAEGGHQSDIFTPGGNTSTGYWFWSTSDNAPDGAPDMGFVSTVTFGDWTAFASPDLHMSKSVLSIMARPTDFIVGINERFSALGSPMPQGSGPAVGGYVGRFAYDNADFYGGRIEAYIICDEAPTDAAASKMRQALYVYSRVKPIETDLNRINLLITGASLDQGQGGDATGAYDFGHNGGGYGWPEILADRWADRPIKWNNVAASGNTTENDLASYTQSGSHCFDPGARKNIAIVGNSAVGNDGFQGHTGATAYAKFVDEVNAAKADGWIVGTYLFDTTGDAPGTTSYDYNVLVHANAESLGVIIVADNVAVTAEGNNPVRGHFNVLGFTQMADQIGPGLLALMS